MESSSASWFQEVPCPVCASSRWRRAYPVDLAFAEKISGVACRGSGAGVARCLSCGHGFIQPMPQPAFLKAFYDNYTTVASRGFYRDRAEEIIPGAFRRRYGPWLSRMAALVPAGARLLDVGTGLGMFPRLSREHGFSPAGVEPNPEWARAIEERHGIPVHRCLFEELETPERYHAVTMWDLLEHLAEPAAAIAAARRLLLPGGLLTVEVPVRDSLVNAMARAAHTLSLGTVSRPLWLIYGVHHLQYFSSASLGEFLGRQGFETVASERGETEVAALSRRPGPGAASRAKAALYNGALRAAFGLARAVGRMNKTVVLARMRL